MSTFTVIYDANVLYPNTLRDILIRIGQTGMFTARWTEKILDEVFTNLSTNRPDLDPRKLTRTRRAMCRAIEDCIVTDYETLIDSIALPDPDDRHVVAAAVAAGAQVIVTENLRDFPCSELQKYGIEAQTADDFLCDAIDLSPTRVHQAVTYAAAALKNPPRTVDDILDSLSRCGAPTAAAKLRR